MDIAAAFNRSKVMHDNNNMTSAAMDSAEASNSDASLPPYMEESDFDDESEVMGDDLRRRVHEHRRKGERLEKEVCTARKQAWNNRHREAMIVTYDTQDVRREDEVTLCGPDDWEPTALSISIWIGLEVLLCQQKGEVCSAGSMRRGVMALESFWESKNLGWKLTIEDLRKIEYHIDIHIREGNMIPRKLKPNQPSRAMEGV